jgi:colicin import membrane protein
MTVLPRTCLISLSLVCLLLIGSAATAQTAEGLNATQKLQLEVNALSTLNSAIANVARKAEYRASYLDAYFQENDLRGEFAKYRAGQLGASASTDADGQATEQTDEELEEAIEEAEDQQAQDDADPAEAEATSGADDAADAEAEKEAVPDGPPADPTPKSRNWSDTPRDQDADVPLTYEDAYALALEYETETNLADARNTEDDLESLQTSKDAWESIAKKKFPQAINSIMDVERKVQFIRETDRWDAFVTWAEAEYDRREEAEKEEAQRLAKEREEKMAEEERERAERENQRRLEREEYQRKRADEVERKWQRKVEAYKLETDRDAARTGDSYMYYPDYGRWWR